MTAPSKSASAAPQHTQSKIRRAKPIPSLRSYDASEFAHLAWICGVDEAGRGPLAGPVFAAAVILDSNQSIDGLRDSKLLSHDKRLGLAALIKIHAKAWCIASASAREIESLNILGATMLAMQRAVQGLLINGAPIVPDLALVDGNQRPSLACALHTVIKGDTLVPAISAASILAKTARDALLSQMDLQYPHYGFALHKGYPTAAHLAALMAHGPCPEHRRTFGPVARSWEQVHLKAQTQTDPLHKPRL